MCVALVVGNSIGSGVFLLPASLAPYGLNSVITWGLTGCGARQRGRLATVGVTLLFLWGGMLLLLGAPLYFLVRNDRRQLA